MSRIQSTLNENDRIATGQALQGALVDLIELALQAKQAHWNVLGKNFRSAHLQLDEVVDMARETMDMVAERAVAIGENPDGRVQAVAAQTEVEELPPGYLDVDKVVQAFVDRYGQMIARFRERIAATETADPVTQDLLIGITARLEESYWMFQAEN